jgi:hypothetical protein
MFHVEHNDNEEKQMPKTLAGKCREFALAYDISIVAYYHQEEDNPYRHFEKFKIAQVDLIFHCKDPLREEQEWNEFHKDAIDLYYQITALYKKMSDGREVEVYFSLRECVG